MRKNTLGLAGLSGMLALVSFVEFGQSYQTLLRLVLNELVCTCKRQPSRSAGQLRFRLFPLTLLVIVKVLVLTVDVITPVKLGTKM